MNDEAPRPFPWLIFVLVMCAAAMAGTIVGTVAANFASMVIAKMRLTGSWGDAFFVAYPIIMLLGVFVAGRSYWRRVQRHTDAAPRSDRE